MTMPNVARARRWGQSGRADPVAQFVAPRLGMRPGSVEQLMKQVNHRCAAIIAAFRALGDDVRLGRFWAPILAAYEQREAPPLVPAVWQIAQAADAKEDVDELAYLLDQSDANLERCIRSKEAGVIKEMALIDALRAEQQRRRGSA